MITASHENDLVFRDFSSFGSFAAFACTLLALYATFFLLEPVSWHPYPLVIFLAGLLGLFSKQFLYEFQFDEKVLCQQAIWFIFFHGKTKCYDLRKTTKNKIVPDPGGCGNQLILVVDSRRIILHECEIDYIHHQVNMCVNTALAREQTV